MIEIGLIRIHKIDSILKTVQENHHTIETKIIETTEIEIILIIDNITIRIIIDPEINLGIEITTTQIDKRSFLNHLIEKILNTQISTIRTTEVVHQNLEDKIIKCSQQKKLNQTLPLLTMKKNKIQNYS